MSPDLPIPVSPNSQDTFRDSPFELDRFQLDAAAAISRASSVVVSAPTGSGKTWIAEEAIARALATNAKSVYTTPIKALSNQKYRDLCRWLGRDKVGLLTGDNSINGDAEVVVMTTEVLRNMLYSEAQRLDRTRVVVMDEVHYLQDSFRGPVWEEVVVNLPSHVQLVALSATVSNAAELAGWISEVHAPCEAITETTRPVPVTNAYIVGEKGRGRLHVIPTTNPQGATNPEGRKFDQVLDRRSRNRRGDERRRPSKTWATPRRHQVIAELERQGLLPAITFIFSRAACDDAVQQLMRHNMSLTTPQETVQIDAIIEERTRHLPEVDKTALGFNQWRKHLKAGVASHHAGIVPLFKETVEELFAMGLLQAVFATETLALGVNMPARTVVIEKLSKFTGDHHEMLSASQYTQLVGRAGRRGIDSAGSAWILWSPWTTFDEVATLAGSKSFELKSAFRPTYNMTCHLVSRTTRHQAEELIAKSFGQYQADRQIERLEARRLDIAGQPATDDDAPVDPRTLEKALAKLKPGDAIDLEGPLAVLSAAWRRRDVIVKVVDPQGVVRILDKDHFEHEPAVLATLDLPQPFNPQSQGHQYDLAEQLASLGPSTTSRASRPTGKGKGSRGAGRGSAAQRKELRRIDARIRDRRGRLNDRFKAVIGLLSELEYVDAWELTERGEALLGVFNELDLVIVESLLAGSFDGHDPSTLAGIASVFVHEPRRGNESRGGWISTELARASINKAFDCSQRVHRLELAYGLPASRELDDGLFAATHAWAAGNSMGEILEDEELSGGDFVRSMKQVIDLVSQIARIAPEPETRHCAHRCVEMMQRGIVNDLLSDAASDTQAP